MITAHANCSSFEEVQSAVLSLADYCRDAGWAGWDPYDGLNSRFFQAIPFLQNKPCRLAFIQFMKRSPVNLRPLVGVRPGQNPKGVALFASALAQLSGMGLACLDEARSLVDGLVERRCPGQDHACWGYHFDWQTRGVLVPSTVPNIVCTTFVANAFLDLYDATRHPPYLEMAESAGRFITDELASDLPADAFCIRYYMLGKSSVHNASLLGAGLLARLLGYRSDNRLEDYIRKAAQFSLDRQRPDGSWPYGEGPKQTWVDSFHTGYNLLAFKHIGRRLEVHGLPEAVRKGYDYYRRHFIREDGAVRYFHDRTYPVDAHAMGHALLTLAEFAGEDTTALPQAGRCFDWAMANLRSPEGYFFYQSRRWFKNRISYMRWSQAWMLIGLVGLMRRLVPLPGASQDDKRRLMESPDDARGTAGRV